MTECSSHFHDFQVQHKRESTSRPLIMQYETDMEAGGIADALLSGKGDGDGEKKWKEEERRDLASS